MNYKNYIKGGIKISELGFGAWQLGVESGWSSVSEKESEYMINTALDSGINFFDTAPNYGNGTSETRLGKVLKNVDRSKIVINTKFGRLDNGLIDFDSKRYTKAMDEALKSEFEKMIDLGYKNLYFIETPKIIDSDNEGTVDAIHLTDLGFLRYADFLIDSLSSLELLD